MIVPMKNKMWPSGLEERKLAIFAVSGFSLVPRRNPGCSGSSIQVETTDRDMCPMTWSHVGLLSKFLGGVTVTVHQSLSFDRMTTQL